MISWLAILKSGGPTPTPPTVPTPAKITAPSAGAGAGAGGAGTFGAPATGFFTPGQTNTQGGNIPPIKTYVLAGDVTSAQAAEAKLNQRRQF